MSSACHHHRTITSSSSSSSSAASKASPECYEDFYYEIKEIEKGTIRRNKAKPKKLSEEEDDTTEEDREKEWLENAGFTFPNEGERIDDLQIKNATMTLTKDQGSVVKNKIAAFNKTISRRQREQLGHQLQRDAKPHRKDVRDLFPQKRREKEIEKSQSSEQKSLEEPDGGCISSPSMNHDKENKKYPHDYLVSPNMKRPSSVNDLPSATEDEHVFNTTFNDLCRDTSPPAPQHTTRIDQLGPGDVEQLKQLAFIELTSIFDMYGLQLTAKKKRKKTYKEVGVFGVPVKQLLVNDAKRMRLPNLRVPLIFQKMICYLETKALDEEGILRVPGSITRINALREELDTAFEHNQFDWSTQQPNDIAGLMKLFLRELPVPLLTFEYIDAFTKVKDIPDKKYQKTALKLLIIMLPPSHRDTLLMLLRYLRRVTTRPSTRMTLAGVAMIIAPNLFLVAESSRKKEQTQMSLHDAIGTSDIAQSMIEHQDTLWTVSDFMLSQIRHKNEISFRAQKTRELKNKSKLLKNKNKNHLTRKHSFDNKTTDEDDHHIEVQCDFPVLGSKFTASDHQTAGDIISQFRQNNAKLPESLSLYAVGGNLNEQQLNEGTIIEDIKRINKDTKWKIKCHDKLFIADLI